MSSLIPTIEPTKSRSLASWLPRLAFALLASILLAGCFTAVGAPVWLSAAIGALGGTRIAASRRLSTATPRR